MMRKTQSSKRKSNNNTPLISSARSNLLSRKKRTNSLASNCSLSQSPIVSSRQSQISEYFPLSETRCSSLDGGKKLGGGGTPPEGKKSESSKSSASFPQKLTETSTQEVSAFLASASFPEKQKCLGGKDSLFSNSFSSDLFVRGRSITRSPRLLRTPRTYRKRKLYSDESDKAGDDFEDESAKENPPNLTKMNIQNSSHHLLKEVNNQPPVTPLKSKIDGIDKQVNSFNQYPKLLSPMDKRMISNTPKKLSRNEMNSCENKKNTSPCSLSSDSTPYTPPSLKFPFSLSSICVKQKESEKKVPQDEIKIEEKSRCFSSLLLSYEKQNDFRQRTPSKFVLHSHYNDLSKKEKKEETQILQEEEEKKEKLEEREETDKTIFFEDFKENHESEEDHFTLQDIESFNQNPQQIKILSTEALKAPIGFELNKLFQFYKCLNTVIDRHIGRGLPLLFYTNLKDPVEQLMQCKRFTIEVLQQMLWICPCIFDAKYTSLKERSERDFDYELVLLCHNTGNKLEKCLTWEESEEREKIFLSSLIQWVEYNRKKSCKTFFNSKQNYSCSPKFDLELIQSIPLKRLPEKPNRSRSPSLLNVRKLYSPQCSLLSELKTSMKLTPINTNKFPLSSRIYSSCSSCSSCSSRSSCSSCSSPAPSSAAAPSSSSFSSLFSSDSSCLSGICCELRGKASTEGALYKNNQSDDARSESKGYEVSLKTTPSALLSPFSAKTPQRSRTPLRCIHSSQSSSSLTPLNASPRLPGFPSSPTLLNNSPIPLFSYSPASPITPRSPLPSRVHSPALQRIQLKEEQKHKVIKEERMLREKEDEAKAKINFWIDVKWTMDRLIDMYSTFTTPAIQQVPVLIKRMSTTFNDRLISASRIENALLELSNRFPKVVQISDSLIDRKVKCLKFNSNFKVIKSAIQEISKVHREYKKEYNEIIKEKGLKVADKLLTSCPYSANNSNVLDCNDSQEKEKIIFKQLTPEKNDSNLLSPYFSLSAPSVESKRKKESAFMTQKKLEKQDQQKEKEELEKEKKRKRKIK